VYKKQFSLRMQYYSVRLNKNLFASFSESLPFNLIVVLNNLRIELSYRVFDLFVYKHMYIYTISTSFLISNFCIKC